MSIQNDDFETLRIKMSIINRELEMFKLDTFEVFSSISIDQLRSNYEKGLQIVNKYNNYQETNHKLLFLYSMAEQFLVYNNIEGFLTNKYKNNLNIAKTYEEFLNDYLLSIEDINEKLMMVDVSIIKDPLVLKAYEFFGEIVRLSLVDNVDESIFGQIIPLIDIALNNILEIIQESREIPQETKFMLNTIFKSQCKPLCQIF